MGRLIFILACLFAASQAESAVGGLSGVDGLGGQSPQIASDVNGLAPRQLTYSFADLGLQAPMRLLGVDGSGSLSFGLRQDEIVEHVSLKLRYSYSPSMLPNLSHIKVFLNGELVATIPVQKEQAGFEQTRELELDKRYLTDFNQLHFELVGHYTLECEDDMHSSLWANIGTQSRLELTVRPIVLNDDLAMLPLPFFDFHDNHRLTVPFVFAGKPSFETLRAAGVVSSWFGALAGYRGARFPGLLNRVPDRHAIVFATNDERPENLDIPVIEGPGLVLIRHPQFPAAKLLLVLGRDGPELEQAAAALVLGQAVLTGQTARIDKVTYPPRREAYDAPNWLKVDRPVKLGELVANPDDLQIRGRMPAPLTINVRVPADLMLWQNKGVPIDLKYRYTRPVSDDNSTLNVSINNQYLQTFRLQANQKTSEIGRLMLPLREEDDSLNRGELLVPALKVGSDNQLLFQFAFDYHQEGMCRSSQLDNVRAAIDPNSTIDFSQFYHYSEMPNLSFFANSGFPFSKYADLAETAVVLPPTPSAMDIETYLTALGLMGKSTGIPALRFALVDSDRTDTVADRDLLLIDTSPESKLLMQWQAHVPAALSGDRRSFWADFTKWPAYEALQVGERRDRPDDATVIRANGSLSALVGFESPLQSGRSVVALTSSDDYAANNMLAGLLDAGRISRIRGDVAFFRGDAVESSQQGEVYYVGDLPFWQWIWFWMARHPIVLALSGILSGLFVAFLAYSALRNVARRRLQS